MSIAYRELLHAVAHHVEDLKRQGVRHLPLEPQTLAALDTAPRARIAKPPTLAPTQGSLRPAPAPITPAPPPQSRPSSAPTEAATDQPVAHAAAAWSEVPAAGPILTPEAKVAAMAELRARALVCAKCPRLVGTRQNVVFGVGTIHADLMFVGEAPGAEEDVQGEPFVGQAGQLLTRIIVTMGFSRETVYIANILKCRPDTPEQAAGNRKPTPEEMQTCLPYLLAQIDLIRPKVMVALGGTAVVGLLGLATGITKLRGRFQTFRGIPIMPTYHPSYLLRTGALSTKREVWEDMLQVLEKLGAPISEKQRNYFLKPS